MQEEILPTHYVGIGASAGGLEALEEFIKGMPSDTGMTFIVVQHLSPDYKSMMVELLSRRTQMKVLQIEDGMLVKANCIYLIPPKKNLTIYHSRLILTEQVRDTSLNLPIDVFFRSLAIDQKKKAVGIILSGTGSDGTLGIKAIKEQGGLVMVQNFSTAKFDGMPKSAIATGLVDYILNADQMSDALVKYVSHPHVLQEDTRETENKEETDFVKTLSLIRTHVGMDFSYYKPKTIIRRIERRISVNQLQDSEEYIKLLLDSKEECEILAREFLIGVTQFFRDKEAYQIIENEVIPELLKNKEENEPIRLWSVGCSTGEEAYSLAILCKEYMEKNDIFADLKIFATDLDKEAIRIAGLGIYPESIVADVSQELLNKHFIKRQGSYQVSEIIRQMVIFANHDVTTDPPFSKISLITCRNLLIYFKAEMQQKVLNMFRYSLSKGGYLFLGSSESISGLSESYGVVNSRWKIFKFSEGNSLHLTSFINMPGRTRSVMTDISKIADNNLLKKANPLTDLYEKTLNFFAPAGVIVDKNNTIIHFFKDIKRYLDFPEGKASYNLLELINPQLTMVISNMLYKARKEKKEIALNKFKFKEDETEIYLNISAQFISIKKSPEEYVVVAIKEMKSSEKFSDNKAENVFNYDEQVSDRIRDLERELQYRDENLQTTIEELETSNEELQATNEELVSSNEELQSTNEELQSVNEELYTVNSQYQEKIHELTELNNDINNLLTNTNIGTLFLDSQLIIRKFTSEISVTMNIIEMDIGRPFSHITFNCDYKNLYEDVKKVLNTLEKKEIEVRTNNGKWYLIKVQPYRHTDNSIHGVLLIQIDIDKLQRAKLMNLRLSQAVEQSVISTVITDVKGYIEYANPEFSKITGYSYDDILGKHTRLLQSGHHNTIFYQELWETIISKKTWFGEIYNKKKDGTYYWEKNVISPIINNEGDIINFLAIKEDITEKKRNEELKNIEIEANVQKQKLNEANLEKNRK